MIMIAFVRRIHFVSPRAADRKHFITELPCGPYIQKVGKMNEKQEISTLMEKETNKKKERDRNADDPREIGRFAGGTGIEL